MEHRVLCFFYLLSSNNHSSDFTSHEHAIISEQEPSSRLPVGLLDVEVSNALFRIVNLPEHDNRAFLAFADVSAKFVSLAHRQPKR
jgi:hypothetical protein